MIIVSVCKYSDERERERERENIICKQLTNITKTHYCPCVQCVYDMPCNKFIVLTIMRYSTGIYH